MTVSASKTRPLLISDTKSVLALNRANEVETAFLDKDEFHALLGTAFYTRTSGNMDGFCIAMDQDALYESPNFQWFSERYDRFIYVDRIIVAAHARGQGVATALYENVFAAAQRAGHSMICCEVNINPPNHGSEKFHTRLGFTRIGQAALPETRKSVGYWTRNIQGAP